jgi:protein-disulfide isomerase
VTTGALFIGVLIVVAIVIQSQPRTTIAAPTVTTPPGLAHDRELGSATAPLTLEVWSDFQCPYCEQFWTLSEPGIVNQFVATGKVHLVYHDYTFLGQESLDAAVAARCADKQGRFWPYHDLLFANQGLENSGAFSSDRLTALAQQAGLDVDTWSNCRDDSTVLQAIQQETVAGSSQGVSGTPTLFLNGAKLSGFDYTSVTAAIQQALGAGSSAPSTSAPTSLAPSASAP